MAVALGTNSGFCAAAPTEDPAGTATAFDSGALATKHTVPAGAQAITEFGWWRSESSTATGDANFEAGVYTHDAANDRPASLVWSDLTNSSGTTNGAWVRITGLNIPVTPNDVMWLAIQMDAVANQMMYEHSTGAGARKIFNVATGTLPDPWPAGTTTANNAAAIYVVYSTGSSIVPILNSYRMRRK